MRVRVTSKLVVVAAGLALAFGAGCGGNDNNGNDNNGGPVPTRTPTAVAQTATPGAPTVTPTPAGGVETRTVTFTADSSAQLLSFTVRVGYPIAKGSFTGSGATTMCDSAAPNFQKNDLDDGTLVLVSASTGNLTFPITITCTFDQESGQTLEDADITPVVQSVGTLDGSGNPVAGDPASLNVTAQVQ